MTERTKNSIGSDEKNELERRLLAVDQDVRACFHQNSLTLLHIGRGIVFTANPTGTQIWQALNDGKSLDGIARELKRECCVPLREVQRDTLRFAAELERQGLLSLA
jgi:hypothetical protein